MYQISMIQPDPFFLWYCIVIAASQANTFVIPVLFFFQRSKKFGTSGTPTFSFNYTMHADLHAIESN